MRSNGIVGWAAAGYFDFFFPLGAQAGSALTAAAATAARNTVRLVSVTGVRDNPNRTGTASRGHPGDEESDASRAHKRADTPGGCLASRGRRAARADRDRGHGRG